MTLPFTAIPEDMTVPSEVRAFVLGRFLGVAELLRRHGCSYGDAAAYVVAIADEYANVMEHLQRNHP